jgi:hypothetical protein
MRLASDAGLLNYVDNETPLGYFIDVNADIEEVEMFAKLVIEECNKIADDSQYKCRTFPVSTSINQYFGLES